MWNIKTSPGFLLLAMLFLFPLLSLANADSLNKAKVLLDEGKTFAAIDVLKELLDETSEPKKRAELQGAIGWALVQAREYTEAELFLERSLRNATEGEYEDIRLRANNNLGIALYLQNKFEESRAYFSQDFAENSATAMTYLKLLDIKEKEFLGEEALLSGVDKRHCKQFEEAINKYDLALKYMPNNPRALEFKGYAQFRLGRLEEAYKTLQLAKNAAPDYQLTYLNLLKVSCALESSAKVKQVVADSGLDIGVYQDWASRDAELQRVCADNNEFSKIIVK